MPNKTSPTVPKNKPINTTSQNSLYPTFMVNKEIIGTTKKHSDADNLYHKALMGLDFSVASKKHPVNIMQATIKPRQMIIDKFKDILPRI